MNDNSYYAILERLRVFAEGHYLINTFTHGEVDGFDAVKDTEFPVMHPTPVAITPSFDSKRITYDFDIIFADIIRHKETPTEYQKEVISDQTRIALDLYNEIMNGLTLFGNDVTVVDSPTIEPFIDAWANTLTGVVLKIRIEVPYNFNACDIPASWADGSGEAPTFGSREYTIDIYDEEEFIVNAKSIDFQGSAVTVTHQGNRAIVTITGGSGGGAVNSVNGQTGTVVLNAASVGADASGSAAAALSSANSYTDSQINALDADDIEETATRGWLTSTLKAAYDSAVTWITTNGTNILNHLSNTSNPHSVTKLQVGLGNVDNTSDVNKPVSTAQQTALNLKENSIATGATSQYWRGDKSWQTLDKSAVGLSNVDNTSDTSKPVSTAQQAALDGKENSITAGATSQYWRGDKSWQTLNKSAVGLGNVDNTSDVNKPISTAVQTELTRITPAEGRFSIIEQDFMAVGTTVYNQLNAAAASSGTQAAVTGQANHPGIVALLDSTTANGGYAIITNNNMLLLAGGEKAIFVFQDRNTTTRATATIRMGFIDSSTNTAPTDGCYVQIQSGVMTAICRNNNTQTASGTTTTITQNTWYSVVIEVISTSLVRFTLYSEAGASLWTQDITTNIPSATGRETGFGANVFETTTDAAAQILWLDYMLLEINRTLVR
jgi:hypothetical protein